MSAYKDKNGRWRYRFSRRGKRYGGSTLTGNNTKAAALVLERAHIERLERNQFTGKMPTIAAFVERYLEFQKPRVKPLTYELNETQIRLHVVPHIGKLLLDEVDAATMADLITKWSKSAAPLTVNARLATALRVLGIAVEWGILSRIPRVKKIKIPERKARFLSDEEAKLLIDAAAKAPGAGEWCAMIVVAIRTGLRIGEIRGLQWHDLALDDKALLHVRRTDPGRIRMASNDPKGGRSRVVPLTPDALACLRNLHAREKRRLGDRWRSDGFVWPASRGGSRPRATCIYAMNRYTKAAGLADVSWHTLRHTFASWLVMRGVPMRIVQDLLGHASIKMTEVYAHLAPGFVSHEAVASLDLPLMTARPMLPPGKDDDE